MRKTLDDEDLLAWPKEEPEVSPWPKYRVRPPMRVQTCYSAGRTSPRRSRIWGVCAIGAAQPGSANHRPSNEYRKLAWTGSTWMAGGYRRREGRDRGAFGASSRPAQRAHPDRGPEHKRGARKLIAGLELYRELKLAIIDRLRATTFTAEQVLWRQARRLSA